MSGVGLPGGVRGLVEDDGRGRVEHAGGGQFLSHRGPAQQLRVERGTRRVDPGVQAVEAPRGPAQVEADRHEGDEDPDESCRHGRKAYGGAPPGEPLGPPVPWTAGSPGTSAVSPAPVPAGPAARSRRLRAPAQKRTPRYSAGITFVWRSTSRPPTRTVSPSEVKFRKKSAVTAICLVTV